MWNDKAIILDTVSRNICHLQMAYEMQRNNNNHNEITARILAFQLFGNLNLNWVIQLNTSLQSIANNLDMINCHSVNYILYTQAHIFAFIARH